MKYPIRRYGDIFKTHILGCPCVMISSPEAARMVLVSKAHLFKPTYPPSKERMIGPEALFFHQGPYHSTLKRLVQSSFMPSALRPTVSHIELLVLQTLSSWTSQKSINTLEYMKRVCLFDLFWVICMDAPWGMPKEILTKKLQILRASLLSKKIWKQNLETCVFYIINIFFLKKSFSN